MLAADPVAFRALRGPTPASAHAQTGNFKIIQNCILVYFFVCVCLHHSAYVEVGGQPRGFSSPHHVALTELVWEYLTHGAIPLTLSCVLY